MNTILCIKWGTAFSPRDVNMLFRACTANSTGKLRFVCLTDETDGLDANIYARAIPDIGLSSGEIAQRGLWRKLSLFSPEIADLGRVLFVDLDMLIVGDVASFFDVTDGAYFQNMGASWRPNPRSEEKVTGTCIFSFDTRNERSVLDEFLAEKTANMEVWTNEQEFVGAHVSKASYWPEGKVISFKRHLCHRHGKGLFAKPEAPAAGASVVAFHGKPRPADTQENLFWGPFPHVHMGRVPWIEDYYRTYG